MKGVSTGNRAGVLSAILKSADREDFFERVRLEGSKRASQGDTWVRNVTGRHSWSRNLDAEACSRDNKVVSVDAAGLARGAQ